ncbi:hypothetical protein [Streptomyces sp. NPDC017949]|uniref:hypothetical protein n=1 Tax=Streptomyces sp. NPDC017949 TaxID=3365020 RepID=UPI0037A1317C
MRRDAGGTDLGLSGRRPCRSQDGRPAARPAGGGARHSGPSFADASFGAVECADDARRHQPTAEDVRAALAEIRRVAAPRPREGRATLRTRTEEGAARHAREAGLDEPSGTCPPARLPEGPPARPRGPAPRTRSTQ